MQMLAGLWQRASHAQDHCDGSRCAFDCASAERRGERSLGRRPTPAYPEPHPWPWPIGLPGTETRAAILPTRLWAGRHLGSWLEVSAGQSENPRSTRASGFAYAIFTNVQKMI